MEPDIENFQKAIRLQGEEEPIRTPVSEEHSSWIEGLAAPDEVKSLLLHLSFKDDFPLGSNCLFGAENRLKENRELKPVFSRHFVVIGSGTSGDPVAIDIRRIPGRVGYLCHEDLWDDHVDITNP